MDPSPKRYVLTEHLTDKFIHLSRICGFRSVTETLESALFCLAILTALKQESGTDTPIDILLREMVSLYAVYRNASKADGTVYIQIGDDRVEIAALLERCNSRKTLQEYDGILRSCGIENTEDET